MIRSAIDSDAMQIARIHVRGWQTAYADQMPREFLDSLTVSARTKDWLKWLKAEHFRALVYFEEAVILGYAAYSVKTECAELLGLYVDPDHKRRGIGSRLMTQFEEETTNKSRRGLWVLSENDPAIIFYRIFGYQESGETREADVGGVCVRETRMEKLENHIGPLNE